MLITRESTKSLDELSKAIEDESVRRGFGVLCIHDLAETMRKKGVHFEGECRIFEVCNPHQAKKVMEHEPLISSALPCRISVFRKEGRYILATIRPTWMIETFNVPGIKTVAEEVEKVLAEIMDSAA